MKVFEPLLSHFSVQTSNTYCVLDAVLGPGETRTIHTGIPIPGS